MKKVVSGIISLFCLLVLGACAAVSPLNMTTDRTKAQVQERWGRAPDKVVSGFRKKLKGGATEMWIYRYSLSDEERYYFKGEDLVLAEYVTWATL